MATYCVKYTVAVTTVSGGTATAYTGSKVTGLINNIRYVKPGSDGFADGSTITITGETTGTPILAITGMNASATKPVRQATCDVLGVASLYDTTDSEPVEDKIAIADERIKIVVSSGGDAKTGTFYFTFE